MAISGTGLRDAIRAARESVALADDPTPEQVAEYADAVELAVWTALVDYLVANVELAGDLAAGVEVEDVDFVKIGETRAASGVVSGGIE